MLQWLSRAVTISCKAHVGKHKISKRWNAGVSFVKGANERNEFFEKINKQYTIYDKQVQTNKA